MGCAPARFVAEGTPGMSDHFSGSGDCVNRGCDVADDAVSFLVSYLRNNLSFVAFKMGCRQGAAKGASPYGAVTERNAAASPFSTQPSGLGHFGDSPALLACPRSGPDGRWLRISALRSRLGESA